MKKKIKSFFNKYPNRGIKSKQLAKHLGIFDDHEYKAFKSALHKLEDEGYLKRKGKRYQLNNLPLTNLITGKLEINKGGYGFVIPDSNKMGDIFIATRNIGPAFHGDKVEVVLLAKQKGKNVEGQVVSVIERSRKEVIGVLKKSNSFFFIVPDDPKIHRDIYIDKDKLNGAKQGEKVVVGKIAWDTSMLNPEGEILEVIGEAGSHDAEIISIAREFNLNYKFSPPIQNEASSIELKITPEIENERIDFREKNVFTIDPEDAKDFDDALSIEILKNGNYSIGIHIADVSHYVFPGSEMDNEALTRGNSVYFVGKVIPMLPEKLSNNICSLVPDEDRLTYSVIVEMTKRAKLVDYKIAKTIINSKRRFTYEEAQKIIETGKGDLSEDILTLDKIAKTLRKKRMNEGSFNFTSPEIKFELDEDGKPVGITKKVSKDSNHLIEEFMLLANKVVASHIALPKKRQPHPFIYRIHDLPDNEKIIEFSKFVKSLGYKFDPNATAKSDQFQEVLQQAEGKPEEAVINELAIRSMAKAKYSPDNIGHYGLGFQYYSHFTSPIRRYADLIAHRLLYTYIDGKNKVQYKYKQLDEMCEHISATERNAMDAERLSVKMKQIEYLKDKVGEEFDAVISGVLHFGIFVELIDILAEGLIKVRDLEGDFYVYDERKYALIGRSTKKQYRLGDKLKVKLIRVDEEKSEVDFDIVD